MNNGWICLHRQILKNWIAEEPDALAVWVRLLLEANFEIQKKLFNGSLVEIKRGQLVYGRKAFSAKSNVSEAKLRRIISLLEKDGMISQQKTNKYSIISIVNYEEYQAIDQQNTSKSPTDHQQTASKSPHYNKDNNVNNKTNNNGDKSPSLENKFSGDDMKAAEWMFSKIREMNPSHKEPSLDKWADTVRLIRERDNKTHKEITTLFKWANNDQFWRTNILSPAKLREKWDSLEIKMKQGKPKRESFDDVDYGETGSLSDMKIP